ncbi:DUF3168 domain-containing protein [Altericroceibacterium spongiae]|uniref:DUF3168 domain-containing protein n=1 Tax=Altericroceibacterium spongiae TaxID=2320269 RepID=A0A420EIN9_9SPHN|nr:DUF3168 domain-containing protein [Altericroceibacterium spongiae]RKF20581.1 DUF3168 domain-containing protein [Altericroceibacterium spongiae]
METALRILLADWLRTDPLLQTELNAVTEEAPSRTSFPWLGIAASASTDWSTKTAKGREVRLAFELHCRGDDPAMAAALTRAIEERIESLPAGQPGFTIASTTFLRARAEQRPRNLRAILLEYRFRLLAAEA